MKKLLSLALALCLTLLPGTAFAADNDFTIEGGILIEYTGPGGDVAIPDGVTSIWLNAFQNCTSLTSVTIPNSVTSIGAYAFEGCSGLTSVNIPNSVTSIGDSAFEGCSGLTSVNIPNSVTSIRAYAFKGCSSLTGVTIPSSVTSIEFSAFEGCSSLTSVNIPSSVTSIGLSAFEGCSGLTSVNIPSSVTSIGLSAFEGCSGLTSVNISDGVASIGPKMFTDCTGLTSVTIPSSVTSIGDSAFEGCSGLTSVNISDGVTSIGNSAFSSCTGLTSVNIPSSVTQLGETAFSGCTGLTDVYYGGSEADWGQINVPTNFFAILHGGSNADLTNAAVHYSSPIPDAPATPTEPEPPAFSDVPPGEYYTDAVAWAVENGITSGTGDGTTFSPDATCSRAQIVTFLYRAMGGEPDGGSSNPFSDVSVNAYYDAILWAAANGITSGDGDGATFSPDAPCTRAQVAAFLWRALGRDEPQTTENPFSDVTGGGDIGKAILWAYEKGITSGTSDGTTFSPDQTCTRGQVVTFLYRAFTNN